MYCTTYVIHNWLKLIIKLHSRRVYRGVWPFIVQINGSSHLKLFANSRPSAKNFKSFSRSLEQLFITVGQNNFERKSLSFDRVNIPWKRRKPLKKIFISLCSLILDLVHQSTLQRNERSTLEWLGDLKVTILLLMQSLIYVLCFICHGSYIQFWTKALSMEFKWVWTRCGIVFDKRNNKVTWYRVYHIEMDETKWLWGVTRNMYFFENWLMKLKFPYFLSGQI